MEEKRKIERKRKRFAVRLKHSKGIICTDEPTNNIILCNSGQANGLDQKKINELFLDLTHTQKPPKLVAQKGQTYSFLIFDDPENACLFYKTYNGKTIYTDGTIAYMYYVDFVPTDEIICQNELPSGLVILESFINNEEETNLLKIFNWSDYLDSQLKNRQVKHYGYEFRYGSNDVDLNSPLEHKIPDELDILWSRLEDYGFKLGKPDQLTVNKYSPGQGIPFHVDTHSPFGGTILSLSLCSSLVMDWKHHTGKYVPVLIPAKSLVIMQNEARYDWYHGIQARTWDPIIEIRTIASGESQKQQRVVTCEKVARQTRISLTFRWTRTGPCDCAFKKLCDSAEKKHYEDIADEIASDLENLHVHQVYEQIATHFSSTRHKPWPRVVQFMAEIPAGSVVLDLGSGNGKNIVSRNDIFQVGCERSAGLVLECQRAIRVLKADCVQLDMLAAGLNDATADAIICIAVIHHFSTKTRRLQALSTISRLLRQNGRALITVWAKDQKKSNYLCKTKTEDSLQQNKMTVKVGDIDLPVHENRTQFQHNDLLVPWKHRTLKENKLSDQPEKTLLRYYHVFEESELENLCNEIPDFVIESSFYEEGNWCVICKKVSVNK